MSSDHITIVSSKFERKTIDNQDKITSLSKNKQAPPDPLQTKANEVTSIASRWNLIPVISEPPLLEDEV